MSLVSMGYLMNHALEHRYAVGYFEAWNMEAVLAVVDAAEKLRSPVIIGFSGNFLSNPGRPVPESIYHYGALCRAIAEHSKVPCVLLLNESPELDILVRGLKAGFNAVMYQKPGESFEEQVQNHRYLSRIAHYCGAEVEAEVGELPTADISTDSLSEGSLTDPEQAAYLVREAGIDALAVAVGNVHLLENKKSQLDFELIKSLRDKVEVPLVLHGGTGLSPEDIRRAIELGICKINVGTVMKRVFLKSVRGDITAPGVDTTDPHELIGGGGPADILVKARGAVSECVGDFIRLFGSQDKIGLM